MDAGLLPVKAAEVSMRDIENPKLSCPSNFKFRKSFVVYVLVTSLICLVVSIILAWLDQSKFLLFLLCFVVLTIWASVVGQLVTPKDAAKFMRAILKKQQR